MLFDAKLKHVQDMKLPWNLTEAEWSRIMLEGLSPEGLAASVSEGRSLPWTEILIRCAQQGSRVLDLGSGRGEHSAHLALRGCRTTLVDFSARNLAFSQALYRALGKEGRFCQGDIAKPLPFANGSYDLVFSCGVLEYFSAPQIAAILKEMFRISKNRAVTMVPNALSIPYRLGMRQMQRAGDWEWGGEVPRYSLRRLFREAGSMKTEEFSVGLRHSLDFLTMPAESRIHRVLVKQLTRADESRPAYLRQGYLLVTIGEKERAVER